MLACGVGRGLTPRYYRWSRCAIRCAGQPAGGARRTAAPSSPLLVTLAGFLYVGLATARDVPFFGELSMEPGPPTPVLSSRRRFLTRLSIGLSSAIAAVVGVPVIGY